MMPTSEAARNRARVEGTDQMAEKKVQPKQPEKDEKAAGSRKATKTSARRVLHKKAAKKSNMKKF